MRGFQRAFIGAQIILGRGANVRVPQEFLDIADVATVFQHDRRGRVPQRMRRDFFLDPGLGRIPAEFLAQVIAGKPLGFAERHEKGQVVIGSALQILIYPFQSAIAYENYPFLVAFADYGSFFGLQVYAVAVKA